MRRRRKRSTEEAPLVQMIRKYSGCDYAGSAYGKGSINYLVHCLTETEVKVIQKVCDPQNNHYADLNEPEVMGGNITFKRLEEEVCQGCSLQHGEMSADGISIHYVEAGDPAGKLVVLIHGFPNFWFVWRNQFQPLVKAGYYVIAPDMRGYNRSSKPEIVGSYARSAVLSDIEKLIDKFGAGNPAILVGHDWGAAIVWCFAEDYPNKVETMVATNTTSMKHYQKILRSSFRQLWKSWYMVLFQIPVLPEWIWAYDNFRVIKRTISPPATHEDIQSHVESYSHPGSVKGGISYYRAAFRGLWSRADGTVPVLSVPVTVLLGDRDLYVLPIVAHVDKKTAPNLKVVQHISESGHWPMWDQPALFNELLLKAISGEGERDEPAVFEKKFR